MVGAVRRPGINRGWGAGPVGNDVVRVSLPDEVRVAGKTITAPQDLAARLRVLKLFATAKDAQKTGEQKKMKNNFRFNL